MAEKHGFACLLHEKPFAGVNGSGKHNNWSMCGPDGKNWLSPGENPHENAKFMMLVIALMKAVDTHADLMRASVASASNDHRLGANEAPPAVVSIFLGECLQDVVDQIEAGGAKSSKDTVALTWEQIYCQKFHAEIQTVTAHLHLRLQATVSSSARLVRLRMRQVAMPINTIMAQALDEICNDIDAKTAAGIDFDTALQDVLATTITKHKRILFNGNGYNDEWLKEATRRGLPNYRTTPEALEAYNTDKARDLFTKYNVFSETELHSRYETYKETYETLINIEAGTAVTMAMTEILPAVVEAINLYETTSATAELAAEMNDLTKSMLVAIKSLKAVNEPAEQIEAHKELRAIVDELETMVPAEIWPLPTYGEMLFM